MKKRIKIAAVAVAVILVLPVFEGGNGINVVMAGTGASPTGTYTSTTGPSTTPGASQSPGQNQPLVPVQTPEASPNPSGNVPAAIEEKERSGSKQSHIHTFEYVRVQEATETQDAVIQLECYCGEVDSVLTEAGSAAGFFIKNVIKKIENAPENGTVTVDTRLWTCYNQKVMDALQKRPDVTLVTNYCYEHEDYTVTIPAGYDVETLLDENGYCGFRYLSQVMEAND
ncbi:hypothetical protein [Parablautia intestinalis]|nr:hypothetical protein [Parablautia intestinalis]